MKIQFDATQAYQLSAISAVVDLFEGQPLAQGTFESSYVEEGALLTESGVGNRLVISDDQLLINLQAVQANENNRVLAGDRDSELDMSHSADKLLSWGNFSVEMETGTGKTYVYLRTIHTLRKKYGWRKFIIVVPSVAIREGVLQSLKTMKEHFAEVFENQSMDAWVYQSKDINKVRSFNRDNDLKVMVMTLDSFKRAGNVLYKDIEGLGQGIDMISQTRPIVIMDEPQKMESKKSKAAIAQLQPLFTLRYSATHKDRYNQIHRLDPVRAYDLGLVKQIMVRSVLADHDLNATNILVKSIVALKSSVQATLVIDYQGPKGITQKPFVVSKQRTDLQELSGGLSQYRGWVVEDINALDKTVTFANDRTLAVGEQQSADRDAIMKAQVFATVEKHLKHEEFLRTRLTEPGARVKVLSVIFIDRVANYAGPTEAGPKIRRWFEQSYAQLKGEERFSKLELPDVDLVHGGYFAKSKTGTEKDTSGVTADDQAIYDEIMRDKTKLLDLDNPRRFIFSHSALREGWDNPNVFQICTLNESKSEDRKRQEIGRGLRLSVNESGVRSFDPQVNRLTVIANEHYEDFAKALQSEIEEDTGVKFDGGRVKNDRDQVEVKIKVDLKKDPNFTKLWHSIRPRTRYQVGVDSEKLVADVVGKVQTQLAVAAPKIRYMDASVDITAGTEQKRGGVDAHLASIPKVYSDVAPKQRIPDVIGYLQRETGLTRATVAKIVVQSGRLGQLHINPQGVLDLLARTINDSKARLMVEGIRYSRIDREDPNFEWELDTIEEGQGPVDSKYLEEVEFSIYSHVRYDSKVEQDFAKALDDMYDDVLTYLKLPAKFKVPTPLGSYNPDWAILRKETHEGREIEVSLVAETKSTTNIDELHPDEKAKILCGRAHFKAIDVAYKGPVVTVEDLER
ncbi:DEAD/DEAH box helicase family protein [Arthrobacter sp. SDTb3-6]|uniref:restriction endonuclease n=1 Tax=Arthrobacter sp. SDTb3-6 TaxID=2713571 RepID=UPI00159E4628|nr:DEAD/DEAH box helicase family protein [Arthrobacter sp. SDTb3-6]NVN00142.1 DEAD/DEAH box helicase family protein [Arthrobacter sp. SDTb3-6]